METLGARRDFHHTRDRSLRRHGRWRKRTGGGFGRQHCQREEAHQHAGLDRRRGHSPGFSAYPESRTSNRVHPGQRIGRNHTAVDPFTQESPSGQQTMRVAVNSDRSEETKMGRNGSNIWPYVIVGSAVGGAVGYLFMTESGRRIRRTIANPEELSGKLEDARLFLERKSTEISDQVRSAVNKAKQSMEAGQQAFREAELNYRSQFRGVESKNDEIASNVHQAV